MVISGYPLAFPQNIVLVAASLRLGTVGNNGRKRANWWNSLRSRELLR
jgi:hypothetical protein